MEGSDVTPANDNVEVPQAANDNVESAGVEAVEAEPPAEQEVPPVPEPPSPAARELMNLVGSVGLVVAGVFSGGPEVAAGLGHEIAGIVDSRGSADLSRDAAAELFRETDPSPTISFKADAQWGDQSNASVSVSSASVDEAGVEAVEHEPVIDPATGEEIPMSDPWKVVGYETAKIFELIETVSKQKEEGPFDERGETLRAVEDLQSKHAQEWSELTAQQDLDPAARAVAESELAARQIAEYTERLEALEEHFRVMRGSPPDKA